MHAYWHLTCGVVGVCFKKYTRILFPMVYYVFLNRAEIFRSEKYTLKEKYSLIEIRACEVVIHA